MQPDSRREDQPTAARKDVKEGRRRFQIVTLEERVAPCQDMYGCGRVTAPGHCK
jgi:hypothetical protein